MAQRISSDRAIRAILSGLSGAKNEGQKLTKNSFHPFPARMPVSVAKLLLEGAAQPGALVLDPMTGSGTTMIAARELGFRGVGLDRDPLAVLLARTAVHA